MRERNELKEVELRKVYQHIGGDPWGIKFPMVKVLEIKGGWVRYINGTYHPASENYLGLDYDPVSKIGSLSWFKMAYKEPNLTIG